MNTGRRKTLTLLTAAAGSSFLPAATASAQSSSSPSSPSQSAPAGAAPAPPTPDPAREVVAGIGGFFFRAHDPKALAAWYQDHLGITVMPTSYGGSVWRQEAGSTAFAPFPEKTGYFGDPARQWMINFRVHNLDRLTSQLTASGIAVKIDPQTYPNGRFAHLHDPEGNPVELWQPLETRPGTAAGL